MQTHADSGSSAQNLQNPSVLSLAGKLQIQLGKGRALVLSKDPEARQLHASGVGGDASYALAEESSGVLQTSGTEGPRCRRHGS